MYRTCSIPLYRKFKYAIIAFLTILSIQSQAQQKSSAHSKGGINWMTIEEVEEQMKVEPRKVYVDVYTDWCYWCKVMENKTFSNKKVIEYMNANFYCIHLNAERKDSITFQGKKYGLVPGGKANDLAVRWMKDRISYPTSVFFDEGFLNPQPVPGYLELNSMEMLLKYIAENKHKSIPWEKYSKEFKGTW